MATVSIIDIGAMSVAVSALRLTAAFNIRSGKFKPPVGLERLQSATDLIFTERGNNTNVAPNRDVGIQLYGELLRGTVSYAAGVFDGVPDLGMGDGDNGNGKDLVGRLFLLPFRNGRSDVARELGIGLAVSRGIQRGSLSAPFLQTYRSPAQAAVFVFRADGAPAGTTVADGLHTRFAPQGYWYAGPVGLQWEYTRSSQVVRRAAALTSLDNRASTVTASWLVTGERASYRGVRPTRPFDPARRQWGALELGVRHTRLLVDGDAFPVYANPASQVRDANTWGTAVNWYLGRGVRVQIDYTDTRFAGGGPTGDRPREHASLTRFQHAF